MGRLCQGALAWPLPSDILKARSVDMRNTVTAVLMGVMLVVAVGNISALAGRRDDEDVIMPDATHSQ